MTILKVINLKLIKDDKKFKLHITQIVKCGESELPSSIKHANMPIFILVNYLFLHSCLLENLAFSPEIVWHDFQILVYTQERALCTSIPIIIQPTLKLKRKKSNGFEQEANVMLYEPVPRPALALISTERQSTPLALDAGGRVEQPACSVCDIENDQQVEKLSASQLGLGPPQALKTNRPSPCVDWSGHQREIR